MRKYWKLYLPQYYELSYNRIFLSARFFLLINKLFHPHHLKVQVSTELRCVIFCPWNTLSQITVYFSKIINKCLPFLVQQNRHNIQTSSIIIVDSMANCQTTCISKKYLRVKQFNGFWWKQNNMNLTMTLIHSEYYA